MLVVDASVIVVALADDDADGDSARERLRGERLAAPELLDLEVASVVRRHVAAGLVDDRRAALALGDLSALPVQRVRHRSLLTRCWQLRRNITIYDAAYVAVAEALEATLLTGDGRLSRAPGLICRIEVFGGAE